jgi:hypothetical protein
MKNRRLTIVAFLLVACLVVGFGYAQLSTTLRIDGGATIDHTGANSEFNAKVYFEGEELIKGDDAKDTIVLSNGDDIATVTITSLTLKDTYVEYQLYVVNEYAYDIYVTPKIDESSDLYDNTLVKLESNWQSTTHEIKAGKRLVYNLKVTCVDPRDDSTSFAIGFTATDVKPTNADDYVAFTGEDTPIGFRQQSN